MLFAGAAEDAVRLHLGEAQAVAGRVLDRGDGRGVAAGDERVDQHVIGRGRLQPVIEQEGADRIVDAPPLLLLVARWLHGPSAAPLKQGPFKDPYGRAAPKAAPKAS